MEELKQQIAVLMGKSYGPERHKLHEIMVQLPEMKENELTKIRRDMQRWQWEYIVRGAVWQMVSIYRHEKGELPYAILVGRDAYGAIFHDNNTELCAKEGCIRWRGVPVIVGTERNMVYLIGEAIPVQIPPYPGE